MSLKNCSECVHKENKDRSDFFCKLHDVTYNEDQTDCEDFEAIEVFESDTYECD